MGQEKKDGPSAPAMGFGLKTDNEVGRETPSGCLPGYKRNWQKCRHCQKRPLRRLPAVRIRSLHGHHASSETPTTNLQNRRLAPPPAPSAYYLIVSRAKKCKKTQRHRTYQRKPMRSKALLKTNRGPTSRYCTSSKNEGFFPSRWCPMN